MRNPESWHETSDDRQELVKTLGGTYVQDNGTFDSGNVIKVQAVFSPDSFTTLKTYWKSRAMVAVIDKSAVAIGNRRVVINGWEYIDKFNYFKVDFELWSL